MVHLLYIWSSRLHASASYCILLPYNTTIDDSSMLCYHEGLRNKMQVRHCHRAHLFTLHVCHASRAYLRPFYISVITEQAAA